MLKEFTFVGSILLTSVAAAGDECNQATAIMPIQMDVGNGRNFTYGLAIEAFDTVKKQVCVKIVDPQAGVTFKPNNFCMDLSVNKPVRVLLRDHYGVPMGEHVYTREKMLKRYDSPRATCDKLWYDT